MAKRTKTREALRGAVAYDQVIAERAFDALAADRRNLGFSDPSAPRLDLQSVAVLAIRIADELGRPDVRARFSNIAKELPTDVVDKVGPAGWALWYATVQRSSATATTSRVQVPVDLVDRATALRATMLKVAQYHLDDDEACAAELADIVSGTGYADLASDLQRLARLYRDHREALAVDRSKYRATDEQEAVETAAAIIRALAKGESEHAKQWASEVNRSYAVLDAAYQRVRPFALAMFAGEGGDDRFPSLFSVRASPTRSEAPPAAAETPATEPPPEPSPST